MLLKTVTTLYSLYRKYLQIKIDYGGTHTNVHDDLSKSHFRSETEDALVSEQANFKVLVSMNKGILGQSSS